MDYVLVVWKGHKSTRQAMPTPVFALMHVAALITSKDGFDMSRVECWSTPTDGSDEVRQWCLQID